MTVQMAERTIDQLDVDAFRVDHPIARREPLAERSARDLETRGHFGRRAGMHSSRPAPRQELRIALDIGNQVVHVPDRDRNVDGTNDSVHRLSVSCIAGGLNRTQCALG